MRIPRAIPTRSAAILSAAALAVSTLLSTATLANGSPSTPSTANLSTTLGSPTTAGLPTSTAATTPTLRMSVMPHPVRDSAGRWWQARSGFVGGTYARFPRTRAGIANTPDDALYWDEVWGMRGWQHRVPNGSYRVTLKLRERTFNRAGQRVFNVNAEGVRVLSNVDVRRRVAAHTAHDLSFTTTVRDRRLDLTFWASKDQPMVSAIQVTPITPATPKPPAPTTPVTSYAHRMVAAYKMVYPGITGALSQYGRDVDLVILAFATQDSGPLALVGYSAQGKASLMADIQARQRSGGKVAISVGGEAVTINTSDAARFVRDFIAIGHDLQFRPDGIDWDIEHANNAAQIVAISRALRNHYGPSFGITYSAGGSNNESDAENRAAVGRALQQAGLLDAYAWQFYMADVSLEVAKWRLAWLRDRGIPTDKLAVGMMLPQNPSQHNISWTNAESRDYMRNIMATMGISKAALWVNPWDAADAQWARDMRALFGPSR